MQSITPLDQVFLRTPFYSFYQFSLVPKNEEQLRKFVFEQWENNIFKEALFIASPELYYEWKKLIESGKSSTSKSEAISISLLKYYTRAITRSTPFGLFSCYSNIQVDNEHEDKNRIDYQRFTSLDAHFLYSLTRNLNNEPCIRNILKYNVNNSLYQVGDDYRYVEVSLKLGKRSHVLTSLEKDEVLALILDECRFKKSIFEISNIIVENVENVTFEAAEVFVNELIDAQILVSDLDFCLNDERPIVQLLNFFESNKEYLSKFERVNIIFSVLQKINATINDVIDDKVLGNEINVYEEIFQLIDELKVPYEKKYLINTNLQRDFSVLSLTSDDLKKVDGALNIVSKFTTSKDFKNSISAKNLQNFKEKFYKRYEENEIPLVVALDNEIGINYATTNKENSFSELIDDIEWTANSLEIYDLEYNQKVHAFWSKVFMNAITESKTEVDLKEYDLSNFKSKTNEMARSFAVMVSKTHDKIIFDNAGGASALEMITRFSNSDSVFDNLVNQVVEYEQNDENILYAEILHIPDDRQGNVLLRKIDRQYETPFLTKSSKKNIISLEDISVCIKNDRIVLKSIKHNKEIKFYNTTAHNFYFNSLPIYQFICDLQYQDNLLGLTLNFGSVNKKTFKFLPRITYGNDIVLSPASWEFAESDFQFENEKYNYDYLKKVLSDNNLPNYFFLTEGDNQLLIDIDNPILLKIVFEEVQKRKSILLKECLYDLSKDAYCNEIVLSYINNDFKTPKSSFVTKDNNVKRTFVPGDEWLYYKIYTGVKTADKILINPVYNLIKELKDKKLINSWFFIRYNDPDFHIRLRVKLNQQSDNAVGKVMEKFNKSLKPYVDSHLVWKIEMDTYQRELERYEWNYIDFCEEFFSYDSEMLIELMKLTKNNGDENLLWVLSIKSIDEYFNLFQFSTDEKYQLMNNLYLSFQEEFSIDKKVKKQIDSRFRLSSDKIRAVLMEDIIYDEYVKIIKNSSKRIDIGLLDKSKKKKIMISLIHMHINRITTSNPRAHELVLYGFFEKYYRQELGKLKYLSHV